MLLFCDNDIAFFCLALSAKDIELGRKKILGTRKNQIFFGWKMNCVKLSRDKKINRNERFNLNNVDINQCFALGKKTSTPVSSTRCKEKQEGGDKREELDREQKKCVWERKREEEKEIERERDIGRVRGRYRGRERECGDNVLTNSSCRKGAT